MSEADRKLIEADVPPTSAAPVLTPRRWGTPLVIGLVVLGVIVAVVWTFTRSVFPGGWTTETISQPITSARAEITLGNTVGQLEVSANNTGNLIDGTLELSGRDRLQREVTSQGGVQIVRLEAVTNGISIGVSDLVKGNGLVWKIGLAPNVPMKLSVKTGVGSGNLELSGLKVTDLTVNSGVGEMTVMLPTSGKVVARIEGGVGSLNVFIPREMQAQIRVSSGLGQVRVNGDYKRDGDVYSSSGFATASDRVQLEVKGGLGRITVEQSGR